MVMWVFGYGSLIWKAGFHYDDRIVGFINGYRRVFYQGSTDHRGTPDYPGRTVTLEPAEGEVCEFTSYLFGPLVCYVISPHMAITRLSDKSTHYLEVREKQYDKKAYVDFFTDPRALTPAVSRVMLYMASPDRKLNPNYLGPAPLKDIAIQIIVAEGPSGPNRDYLFQLEKALIQFGFVDRHVMDLANEVRCILSEETILSVTPWNTDT